MSSVPMTTASMDTRVKRHPFRGAFYGALLGIGVAIYLVLFAVTPFSISTMITVVAIAAGVGLLWGTLAPAKKLDNAPPMRPGVGETFARKAGAEDEAAPTYEDTFGTSAHAAPGQVSADPEATPGHAAEEILDDSAFGAEVVDDSAFGAEVIEDPPSTA